MVDVIDGKTAKRILSSFNGEKRFWVTDGTILKNLRELVKALKKMGENTFTYHSNEEKNDFKNWIGDVMDDAQLANAVARLKTKEEMAQRIEKRIIELRGIIRKDRDKRTKTCQAPKGR